MSEFKQLDPATGLYDCLSEAIDAIGTPQFPIQLARLIREHSPYNQLFAIVLFADEMPEFLFSNLPGMKDAEAFAPYLKVNFLLDPFYVVYTEGTRHGVHRLDECVPDDFYTSDYYRHYYVKTGLVDECAVLIPTGEKDCIFLSLGHIKQQGKTGNEDTANITTLYPLIRALCQRHWPTLKPGAVEGVGRVRSHLDQATRLFGSKILTAREREVVNLVLRGHSGKSVANQLGISLQTVKNHRKNIHAKLGIATQGELFSVFLSAVSSSPLGSNEDPLVHYMNRS